MLHELDNNVTGGPSSGSGDFDMTLTLSAEQSALLSGFSHVYLFSQFGTNFANNDGYEEWVAVVPEPAVAWLLALGDFDVRRCITRRGEHDAARWPSGCIPYGRSAVFLALGPALSLPTRPPDKYRVPVNSSPEQQSIFV